MSTVFNPETAELVNYHGSRLRLHGEWYLTGPCICRRCTARVLTGGEVRYELADVRGPARITCVRRGSFTSYSDIPQAPPEPLSIPCGINTGMV